MNIYLPKAINITILLLIFILPFSPALGNIFLIALIVLVLINNNLSKKKFYSNLPIVTFLILSIFNLLNNTFQATYESNKIFWRLFPLLVLGFITFTQLELKNFKQFKQVSIISCFIYISICSIKTIIFYLNNGYLPFGNNAEITEILSIHRPYLGFYILINILFCLDIFLKIKTKLHIVLAIIFTLFLTLILARLSIIGLIISIFIYFIFYSKIQLKNRLIFLLSSIIIITTLTAINPKISERLNYKTYENFIDYEPRFVIWKSVSNIINNDDYNAFIGYGNGKLIDEYLVENYKNEIKNNEKREYFLSEKFNTHSQFLNYLLIGGYPLLFLFCFFFIALYLSVIKDPLATIIITNFILFFSVENLFVRQFGCYLFIIFIGYSLIKNKPIKT